jgi:CHAD domain-containing protein
MHETDQEFASKAFRYRVDVFTARLLALMSGISEKGIHDTRVESRRLRAALEAFRDHFPPHPFRIAYRDARRITRLLGKPRETAVSLALLHDLAPGGPAESPILECLTRRLNTKLKKQMVCLEKKIGRLDPIRIRSRLDFLLAVMEPNAWDTAGTLREPGSLPVQPTLFPMQESALSRGARIVKAVIAPICEYRTAARFAVASDEELHSLRIISKKARYALEIYSQIWPGGLAVSIDSARSFQDAAGRYHDWTMLRAHLDNEAKRLNSKGSDHLGSSLTAIVELALLRRESMKTAMRAALLDLQDRLDDLRHAMDAGMSKPNLRAMKGASSKLRTAGRSGRQSAAFRYRAGRVSARA